MTLTADEARAITDSRLAHTQLDWLMAHHVYSLIEGRATVGESTVRLRVGDWSAEGWDLVPEVMKRLERAGYTVVDWTQAQDPEVRVSW